MGVMKKILQLMSFYLAFSFAAYADDLKSASESVLACQSLAEAERLACYDQAVIGLEKALTPSSEAPQAETPEIQVSATEAQASAPEKEEAEKRGFLPSWVSLRGSNTDEKNEEPSAYTTTVVSVTVNSAGRHFLTTEDGTVWRQNEIERIREIRDLPAQVEIKKGALGSIRMRFLEGRRRPYRVSALR